MEKIAVYPGSFDPVTNGHLDIIHRSLNIFDKIVVTVVRNRNKQPTFSLEERKELIHRVTENNPKIVVDICDGLLVDYVKEIGANTIVKGLRAISDFDYEFQMALTNRKLSPEIETVFLMTSGEFSFLSSSVVREIAKLNGDISGLVPAGIKQVIEHKFRGGKR